MLKTRFATQVSIVALLASANNCAQEIIGLNARSRINADKRKSFIDRLLSRIDAAKEEIALFDGDKKVLRAEIRPAMDELKASFEGAGKLLWSAPTSSDSYRKALTMFDLHNGHLSDDSGLAASGAIHRGRSVQTQRPATGDGHD